MMSGTSMTHKLFVECWICPLQLLPLDVLHLARGVVWSGFLDWTAQAMKVPCWTAHIMHLEIIIVGITMMPVLFADHLWSVSKSIFLPNQSHTKPLEWKHYIDDIFSLWDINRQLEFKQFIELHVANHFYQFAAEISEKEAEFLDTIVYKGTRFDIQSILDVRTHFKPTETFQYSNYFSCHPPGEKIPFVRF